MNSAEPFLNGAYGEVWKCVASKKIHLVGQQVRCVFFLTSTFYILYCGIYHVTLGFSLETRSVNTMLSHVAEMPKVARGTSETLAL